MQGVVISGTLVDVKCQKRKLQLQVRPLVVRNPTTNWQRTNAVPGHVVVFKAKHAHSTYFDSSLHGQCTETVMAG